jgi:hypothetical protein
MSKHDKDIFFTVRVNSKEQRQALADKLKQAAGIMELEYAEMLEYLLDHALPPAKQK